MVAEDRQGGRGGDRQFVVLALRHRRSADRAGGQRRRGRGLPQEGHHRQSELLDCATRCGAQAAARQGQDQARGGSEHQSVSGAGKEAMDELFSQTKAVFTMDAVESKKFPKRMAFNVIPHIDVFLDRSPRKSGRWWSRPRRSSTRRSSWSPPACACRSSSVTRRRSTSSSREPITADEARDILRNAPGCIVIDKREPGRLRDALRARPARTPPTPQPHPRGRHGRERPRAVVQVSDNLRKGAALNAIQIAECLLNRNLIQAKKKAA